MGCKINAIVLKDWSRLVWTNTFILKPKALDYCKHASNSPVVQFMPHLATGNRCPIKREALYLCSFSCERNTIYETGQESSCLPYWRPDLLSGFRQLSSSDRRDSRIVTVITTHSPSCPRSRGGICVCSPWLAEGEWGLHGPVCTDWSALGNAHRSHPWKENSVLGGDLAASLMRPAWVITLLLGP